MICVSINENTIDATVIAIKNIVFAEIRLDLIEDLTFEGLEHIINANKSLIITFRSGKVDEALRILYLSRAIELGVKFIDIEIETEQKTSAEIIHKAKHFKTKVIMSYHNYEKTPSLNELLSKVVQSKKMGADFVKIATFINSPKENIILMNLLGQTNKTIVIGMGKKGKISRVMAFFFGSPFTFASISEGKETADGQLDYKSMECILRALQ